MATRSKAVAEKEEAQLPAVVDFESDAGAGFEDTTASSFAIPFLQIIQSNSPQVDPDHAKYIDGAKTGLLFNTVTEKLFESAVVVPCHYTNTFIEWVLREEGGGYVREMPAAEAGRVRIIKRDEKNRDIMENGHELKDHRNHYVMIYNTDTGDFSPAIISLTSTGLKVSRKWMSQMNDLKKTGKGGVKFTPPMFSQMYRVTTIREERDGNTWRNWKIEHIGDVTDPALYEAGKAFQKQVREGQARADFSKAQDEGGASSSIDQDEVKF